MAPTTCAVFIPEPRWRRIAANDLLQPRATTHTSQSATHHGRFVSRAMACENGERLASTGTNADARNKLLRPDANTCAVYVPEPRWRRMCSDQQGQPHESRTIASTEVATRQFDNHVLLNLTTLTEFVTSTNMSIESTSKLRRKLFVQDRAMSHRIDNGIVSRGCVV